MPASCARNPRVTSPPVSTHMSPQRARFHQSRVRARLQHTPAQPSPRRKRTGRNPHVARRPRRVSCRAAGWPPRAARCCRPQRRSRARAALPPPLLPRRSTRSRSSAAARRPRQRREPAAGARASGCPQRGACALRPPPQLLATTRTLYGAHLPLAPTQASLEPAVASTVRPERAPAARWLLPAS